MVYGAGGRLGYGTGARLVYEAGARLVYETVREVCVLGREVSWCIGQGGKLVYWAGR